MKNCDYCKKKITSPLRKRFCSDDCCYKSKLESLPSFTNPQIRIKKVYSKTHFDWRDYPTGAII